MKQSKTIKNKHLTKKIKKIRTRIRKTKTYNKKNNKTFKKGGAPSILINKIKNKDENAALYLIKNNPNNVSYIDTVIE